MLETFVPQSTPADIAARVEPTLLLMHRWGYVPTVESLAAGLKGGGVPADDLLAAISESDRVRADRGFVYLLSHEHLVEASRRRVASNRALNGNARAVAKRFARELVRSCPYVECVALSGSLASGGFRRGDDIDFDLFVQDGTKYTSYLVATLLGLRYAWRYRKAPVDDLLRTPLVPKVTCINVVWSADQVRPFRRQDEGLAFELSRCEPLFGEERFRTVLQENRWVFDHFPQLEGRVGSAERMPPPNGLGSFVLALGKHPRAQRVMERLSRALAWVLYSSVQWMRKGDPEAAARMEFLRRVKYPYEVFQD